MKIAAKEEDEKQKALTEHDYGPNELYFLEKKLEEKQRKTDQYYRRLDFGLFVLLCAAVMIVLAIFGE